MSVKGKVVWLGSIDCEALDEYGQGACMCCHGGTSTGQSEEEVVAQYLGAHIRGAHREVTA